MQLLHALDLNDGSAGAGDLGAHLVEHVGEVHDLGLARRVVDNGGALGLDRSHDEVLRGTDAGEFERHRRTGKTLGCVGVNVAVIGVELNAQGAKAQDVHVDLACTEITATGHRDLGTAKAPKQRTHDGGRCAHLGHQVIRRLPGGHGRGIDAQRVLIEHVDSGTHALEHLAHHMDVRDIGHVLECGGTRREQRCGHELERRVLRTRDGDRAADEMTTFNADDIQAFPFQKNMPGAVPRA